MTDADVNPSPKPAVSDIDATGRATLSHVDAAGRATLSHVDAAGRATMVDVGDKPATDRTASATGTLICAPATLALVAAGRTPKGAVISTAELAGIMAAKRTADLIPLCHPLPLTKVAVTITPDAALPGFRVTGDVRTYGLTGVEMEALTAVSVACLTLFDMLKAVDKTMRIDAVMVHSKTGGRSGAWAAASTDSDGDG